MRTLVLLGLLAACGDGNNNTSQPDLAGAALATLTVNNTLSWCNVTVTVAGEAPVMFSNSGKTFMAAAGSTVTLSATPTPGFIAVKWTGTTTMNGANATYVMTSAAGQTVTACCPFPDGTGC